MAKLVLVRHGQSVWNLQNRFTGWVDVSLSEQGQEEDKKAGEILKNIKFDVAFTSTLTRARQTLFTILNNNMKVKETGFCLVHDNSKDWYSHFDKTENDSKWLEVHYDEALNERYYGDLQGLNKKETAEKYGEEQVHIWRRSFDVPPPNGESLKMTSERTIPYFKEKIAPLLKQGKNVVVSAHGNSLRSIVMFIEKMTPEEILQFEMKTGIPHEYDFDENLSITNKKILN